MTQKEKQQLFTKLSIIDFRREVVRRLVEDQHVIRTFEELRHEVASRKMKILSNCYGRINHILVVLPGGQRGNANSDRRVEERHVKRLESLFDALEHRNEKVQVTLFSESAERLKIPINDLWKKWQRKYVSLNLEKTIEKDVPDLVSKTEEIFSDLLLIDKSVSNRSLSSPAHLRKDIEELVKFMLGADLSMWVQDPFVVLRNQDKDNNMLLLEPGKISQKLKSMTLIANWLQLFYKDELSISLAERIGWHLEGGNVLAGDDYVLIGADNYRIPFNNRAKVAEALGISSAKKVYVIKSDNIAKSPAFMTRNPVAENFKTGSLGKRQPLFHLDLFLTLLGKEEDRAGAPERILAAYPVAIFPASLPVVEAVRKEIDNVIIQLKKWGFKVFRNPMPLIYHKNRSGTKQWYFAYYNNCIVEVTNTSKTVWLPSYGKGRFKKQCAKYDTATEWIWRNLGFQPIWAGDYADFADEYGSLHCTIKCLERNHY